MHRRISVCGNVSVGRERGGNLHPGRVLFHALLELLVLLNLFSKHVVFIIYLSVRIQTRKNRHCDTDGTGNLF